LFTKIKSRAALVIATSYLVLELGLDMHVALRVETEGKPFAFLIFGFPWSLAVLVTPHWTPDWVYLSLVLFLNTATIYALTVSVIRLLDGDEK
jgi:hypothetical protein